MNLDYKQYPENEQLIQYQNTILNIFKLSVFDESNIVSILDDMYNGLEKQSLLTKRVKDFLLTKASILNSTDLKIGFMVLYSYEYCDKYCQIIQNGQEGKYTPFEFELAVLKVE
jgi:hypothetical protein